MMVFVIGGSGSGKSSYAEKLAVSLFRAENVVLFHQSMEMYYLATMQVFDEEGRRKVERHKRMRSGKGFLTVEQPRDIHLALGKMETGKGIALLECISNLAANEMFAGGQARPWEQAAEHIVKGVEKLKAHLAHLVVVSSNVFEDGSVYDTAVMEYIQAMGIIHQKLAVMADQVVETVAGIPIVAKHASWGHPACRL